MKKEDKEKLRAEVNNLMNSHLPLILKAMESLLKIPYRTEEEEEELQRLRILVKQVEDILGRAAEFFGNSALGGVITYYYGVKEKAEAGDPDAQKIYNELKPLFEDVLREQMGGN